MEVVFDIETTGLDPLYDRVTAIGIKTNSDEIVLMDKSEKKLLQRFWRYLRKFDYFNLIGYNCWNFDVPFINIRSLKHRIKVIKVSSRIIDLRYILSNGKGYSKGTLIDYAELLGFDGKYKNLTGKDAIRLWEEGKVDKLKRYAMQDTILTYKIYLECKSVGLIKK